MLPMPNSRNNVVGFTLIELMIVMLISTLLLSLVGPFAINQLDKFRVAGEIRKLELNLKAIGNIAFLTHTSFKVTFNEQKVDVYKYTNGEGKYLLKRSVYFDDLIFESQELVFNRRGFSATEQIVLKNSSKMIRIEKPLKDLINNEL